ncbi:MAG: hypothetical protein SD837_06875 [Candidatus Electrothrix scaldis]|nr:MAG: hypothetical protein SD837_06875 [Candidatus Electrothrix sp. GW3-3]
MLTHEKLKKKMLSNPDVKAEYDTLEKEFTLFDELRISDVRALKGMIAKPKRYISTEDMKDAVQEQGGGKSRRV